MPQRHGQNATFNIFKHHEKESLSRYELWELRAVLKHWHTKVLHAENPSSGFYAVLQEQTEFSTWAGEATKCCCSDCRLLPVAAGGSDLDPMPLTFLRIMTAQRARRDALFPNGPLDSHWPPQMLKWPWSASNKKGDGQGESCVWPHRCGGDEGRKHTYSTAQEAPRTHSSNTMNTERISGFSPSQTVFQKQMWSLT